MEGFFFVIALLVLAVLIAPAAIAISSRKRSAELIAQMQREMGSLRDEVDALKQSLERLQQPPADVAAPLPVVVPPVPVAPRPVTPPPAAVFIPPRKSEAPYRTPTFPNDFTPQPESQKPAVPPPFTEPERAAKKSIEQQVGTNWLNRIGITLLVFGIAFGLQQVIAHVGPFGKILVSYVIAAAMLGGGLWLERKPQYRVFARAGIGGGWALLFLVTYAMHYFAATLVLQSEVADLVLLLVVGAGMVVHSLRYRSQVITGLAFLLAFSTVTLSQVTVFSLLASAVLALGLEIVCAREAWFVLEIAGIAAAYGNHFLWLERTLDGNGGPHHPFAEFWPSAAVLLLFYLIFRIGYVLRRPQNEEQEGLSGIGAVLNAVCVLFLMRYQSIHPEWAFRALLGFSALEFAFAFFVRSRKRNAAFAVLSLLASVLLFAAVPLHYAGVTQPMVWVVLAEALWLAGFFLREKILRITGKLALLGTLAQLTLVHAIDILTSERTAVAIVYAMAAAALWVNAEWLCKKLELPPNDGESVLFPVSSGLAACAAAVALWVLLPGAGLVFAWAAFSLALFELGLWSRRAILRVEAYGVAVAVLVRLFSVSFAAAQASIVGIDGQIVAAVVVMAACVWISERLRRSAESTESWEKSILSGAAATASTTVLSTLLYLQLREEWLVAGWATLLVLQILSATFLRDGVRQRAQALLLAALVITRALVLNFGREEWRQWPLWTALALMFASAGIAFRLRTRKLEGAPFIVEQPEQTLFFLPLGLLVILLAADLSSQWLTMAWSLLGVVIFLLALGIGERSFRLAGVGLLLLGVAKLVCWDVWQLEATARYLSLIGVGIALLGVSFLYSRYADRLKEYL